MVSGQQLDVLDSERSNVRERGRDFRPQCVSGGEHADQAAFAQNKEQSLALGFQLAEKSRIACCRRHPAAADFDVDAVDHSPHAQSRHGLETLDFLQRQAAFSGGSAHRLGQRMLGVPLGGSCQSQNLIF